MQRTLLEKKPCLMMSFIAIIALSMIHPKAHSPHGPVNLEDVANPTTSLGSISTRKRVKFGSIGASCPEHLYPLIYLYYGEVSLQNGRRFAKIILILCPRLAWCRPIVDASGYRPCLAESSSPSTASRWCHRIGRSGRFCLRRRSTVARGAVDPHCRSGRRSDRIMERFYATRRSQHLRPFGLHGCCSGAARPRRLVCRRSPVWMETH